MASDCPTLIQCHEKILICHCKELEIEKQNCQGLVSDLMSWFLHKRVELKFTERQRNGYHLDLLVTGLLAVPIELSQ